MKAVLIRVGIDKGYGFLSPVFPDYTYKYIPIYYKNIREVERSETRTYYDLSKQLKNGLVDYVPTKHKNKTVHYDPEFESCTYGDPSNPKRGALLKLTEGDLLIFYLGGELHLSNYKTEMGCFIFGYFEVDKIYKWDRSKKENEEITRTCTANAHIRSSKSKNNLVIVKGSKRSRLLNKSIYFTEPNKTSNNPPYLTREIFTKKYGIRKNVVRSTPQTIVEQEHITNLKKLLDFTI